jgi:hypothetical protein
LANRARSSAARQRRTLAASPASVVIPALVHPTREIGNYTLGSLFATKSGTVRRLLPGVGPTKLAYALRTMERDFPCVRDWRPELKLGQLTTRERRRLLKALLSLSEQGSRKGRV